MAGVFASVDTDFNKDAIQGRNFKLDGFTVPVLVVIKKNASILANLEKWLFEFNKWPDGRIGAPVLVIDDEADDASVNTKKEDEKPASINRGIRSLIAKFSRSSYVGFTATPFANVFINPDTDDDLLKDDLFPKHFIYALEPPSNYFGPQAIFGSDAQQNTLRAINDAHAVFPPKHKITLIVDRLSENLIDALKAFLLTTTIRDLRGEGPTHLVWVQGCPVWLRGSVL